MRLHRFPYLLSRCITMRHSSVNWVRLLKSGQEVSYNQLPRPEVWALALALDEWEQVIHNRRGHANVGN